MNSAETLRDPLSILGHDIFVDIVSWLCSVDDLVAVESVSRSWRETATAHSSWLWRFAAIDMGLDECNIKAGDYLAETGEWAVDPNDHRLVVLDPARLLYPNVDHGWLSARSSRRPTPMGTPGVESTRVNWRAMCEEQYQLNHAWSRACCRLRWITPPTPTNVTMLTNDLTSNTVWRIKSVPEENVLLATSRRNGLIAVDRSTSEPLFSINGLDAYAHLEAGRGFAVFNRPGIVQPMAGLDVDEMADTALEVWRSGGARRRSDMLPCGQSSVAETAESHTDPDIFTPADPVSPLLRGHLEHYRTLVPPTNCTAFRLHVDGADSPKPKAVLATAGTSAIYIWHLEEERPRQQITRGWQDIGRPNYIELDDEYVFVCLDLQMHVYSRDTLSHVVSFPPRRCALRDSCKLAYSLSLNEDFKAIPDEERERKGGQTTAEGKPAPTGRAHVYAYRAGDDRFEECLERGVAMLGKRSSMTVQEDTEFGFSACHYTSKHLVCTAKSGAIFIVQDYKDVFKRADGVRHTVAENTHMIGLGTTVRQLTVAGEHLAACTSFNVILIDTAKLPDVRESFSDAYRPQLRAHVLLGNHPQAMKMSSCIQADSRSIYLTYWAAGETEAAQNHNTPNFPPTAAIEGFGMCVKVWTFSADWANSLGEDVDAYHGRRRAGPVF